MNGVQYRCYGLSFFPIQPERLHPLNQPLLVIFQSDDNFLAIFLVWKRATL